jgi:hypothetical protein
MKQWIVSMVCGGLLAGAISAQARTIESFAGPSGGSSSLSQPGFASGGFPGFNSFPPGNDPTGRIGRIDETEAAVFHRFEWLSGQEGITATTSLNSTTLAAVGKLVILATSGVETRTTLTWDGSIFSPGPGLGGQDLTDSPSGSQCASTPTADRLVFVVLEGDANVLVEITIEDTTGNTATFTQTGLPDGSVDFRYTAFDNAANVDFTSVDAMTVILSGTDTALSLEEITTGCDPNDDDGDGVTDDQDACPASDLRPTVAFDPCDSGVRNPRFPSGCTLSDVFAECLGRRNPRPCIVTRTQRLENVDVLTDRQRRAINDCF